VDEAYVLDISRDAITVLLIISSPPMLIALSIGLIIALFQALTQMQEMTLTFVPKILILFISLLFLAPFMLQTLTSFTERQFDRMIGLGL